MTEELGMSTRGYGKIERNEVTVTVEKLFKIAEALSVDVGQIITFDDSQHHSIISTAKWIGGSRII